MMRGFLDVGRRSAVLGKSHWPNRQCCRQQTSKQILADQQKFSIEKNTYPEFATHLPGLAEMCIIDLFSKHSREFQ